MLSFIDAKQACQPIMPLPVEDVGLAHSLKALPGCNLPWPAGTTTKPTCTPAQTPPSPAFAIPQSVIPAGWTSVGCIAEPTGARALNAYKTTNATLTLGGCVSICNSLGYKFAGAEYCMSFRLFAFINRTVIRALPDDWVGNELTLNFLI